MLVLVLIACSGFSPQPEVPQPLVNDPPAEIVDDQTATRQLTPTEIAESDMRWREQQARYDAEQRAKLAERLEAGNYYGALEILDHLFDDGKATQEDIDRVFPKFVDWVHIQYKDADLHAASLLLIWKDRSWFAPHAATVYTKATEDLRPAINFRSRDFKPGHVVTYKVQMTFGCWDEGDFALDMAELAESLGRADDARMWKIHHADILAIEPVCEQCSECDEGLGYLRRARKEYLALGMTKDAETVAKHIKEHDPEWDPSWDAN